MELLYVKLKPFFNNLLSWPVTLSNLKLRLRLKDIKFGLMNRIFILTFLISVLPISILLSTMYYDSKSTIEKDIQTAALQFNSNIMNEFSGTIENESNILKLLAADQIFLDFKDMSAERNRITQKLSTLVQSKEFVDGIYVKMEAFSEPISYSKEKSSKFSKDDINGNYLYNNVKKKKTLIVSNPYPDDITKKLLITLSAPIIDDSNQVIGAINMDISMDYLSKYLYSYISKSGMDAQIGVMIYLDNGTIITSTNEYFVNKRAALLAGGHAIINGREKFFSANFMNDFYHFYRGEKSNGLNILCYVKASYILNLVKNKLAPLCYTTLIVFIIAIVVGLAYAYHFLRPIQTILKALKKVKSKHLNAAIDTKSIKTKDIFEIANATNELISSLKTSIIGLQDTSNHLVSDADAAKGIIHKCNTYGDETLELVQNISAGAKTQMQKLKDSIHSCSSLNEKCEAAEHSNLKMQNESLIVTDAVSNGVDMLKKLEDSIVLNNKKLNHLKNCVSAIGDKSTKIQAILTTMQKLTKQTNLLAVNASIEANRAGDSGRGFVIVANEIKKLADASSDFALEIEQIISENISSINQLVLDVDQVVSVQENTNAVLHQAESKFSDIEKTIYSVQDSIRATETTLKDIASSKDNVITEINNVYSVAQETTASTEIVKSYAASQVASLQEVLATFEGLKTLSGTLDDMVNAYTL